MIDCLQCYQYCMEEEFYVVEFMQMLFLKMLEELVELIVLCGVEVEVFYWVLYKFGGDLWEVFEVDEDCFGLLMFDLLGYGVNVVINVFCLYMLINFYKKLCKDLVVWLVQVFNDFYCMLFVEYFLIGFYGIFDWCDCILIYVGVGVFMFVLIWGDEVIELDGSGVIMGCLLSVEYEICSIQL